MKLADYKSHFAAHRGGCSHLPENSIAAFEAAAKAGIGYIEMDVMMTEDWKVVVHHDDTLERMTGHNAGMGEVTFEKLSELKLTHEGELTDQKVPTLKEVLQKLQPYGSKVLLEIKPPAHRDDLSGQQLALNVYKIVRDTDMLDRCIFMSVDIYLIEEFKVAFPNITACYPALGNADEDLNQAIDKAFNVFGCPRQKYSSQINKRAHSAGLETFVFTLETLADSETYLSDKVDIVMPKHITPLII